MKWSKQRKITLIILAALLIMLPWLCKKDKTPKVVTEKVSNTTITETVEESGKIFPTQETKINVEPGAIVNELYAKDGDTVAKGTAIASVTIESTSMSSGRSSAQINPANLNPANIAQLMQQAQAPSTSEVKRIQKTVTIYAPMSGVLSEMGVKKGDRISSGYLGKVSNANEWEVRADVGEIDVVKLKEGQVVKIKIDALPNHGLTGYIYSITNSQQSNTITNTLMNGNDAATYKVYIKVNRSSLDSLLSQKQYTLRSGMNTSIKIETNTKKDILAIPIKAVTTRYENATEQAKSTAKPETIVFVVKDNKVEKRKVSLGIQDINNIEIIDGLKLNELIVIDPFEAIEKKLEDKMKVKIVKAADLVNK